MKRLYLFRHAKSSHDNPSLSDLERPLNERGVMAANLMGQYLKRRKMRPDLILCSPSVRTRQTLKCLKNQFTDPLSYEIVDPLYLAQPFTIMDILKKQDKDLNSVMIIGHNPAMNILAHDLNDGKNREDHKRLIEKFPTAALAILDFPTEKWKKIDRKMAKLDQFICPKDLI